MKNILKNTLAGALATLIAGSALAADINLLNVSYDPTRELYREYNAAFSKYWQAETGQSVNVRQSHGGSGSQARAVIDGLDADVVTLALAYDVDALRQHADLIPENWQSRLANNSSPYTSTIVLLVRKGNPKNIKDWDDLVRDDVEVITPNPKTSGGARWNYLAAWGYALKQNGGDEEKAYEFVRKLFANVPVLDPGARGATNTFVQRGLGDVFIAWENEAYLSVEQLGKGEFEIVVPSVSILAEPPVTVVDKNVDRKGTREVAEAYLQYLYSEEAQRIAARNYYRPSNPEIAREFADKFVDVELFRIDDVFGGWEKAQNDHFNDGGKFDSILESLTKR
ncbi:MAG: sulfate ABC transporter substrate-binding protein [Pseudomonadaceae bacterium]|uniref:Sulfate transport system substrate-binding protein n=1 Tax=Halopseudomonas formosensis TaxID=1002526 RepID=A0A1I6BA17_9GAMM|nr:sulfate ABC transporter substrate-binding protein [Halopseudomonas formosensis]MDY3197665.1 sulfate ABC transporter substrate-binding protein [Pseudomonadaceae bacterium]SFQ77647.1 sulfate transport system substrate-binding protein [Halopseudomonas formosensis]